MSANDRDRRAVLSLVQGTEGKIWSESLLDSSPIGKTIVGWSSSSSEPLCEWTGISCNFSTNDEPPVVTGIVLPSAGLSATIPPEIRVLSGLETLNLQGNLLHGSIPPELAAMPKLRALDLSANMLTGTVPPSFASKKLAKLILNENDLTGRFFPDADAPHLASLAEVNLASNLLTGTLHGRTISRMTELDLLSLSENDLSGLVPGKQLGGLPNLEYLYLDSNHFVGPLPAKLAQVGKAGLKELWLQMNDFSGTVPVSYVRFDHLVDFYIDGNKLTGVLPPEICGPDLNSDFFVEVPPEAERNYCDSIACPAGMIALEGVYPCRPCAGGGSASRTNPYLGHEGECELGSQREILEKFYKATSLKGDWKGGSDWDDKDKFMCDLTGVTCDMHYNIVVIALGGRGLTGSIVDDVGFLPFLERLDLSDNDLTGYLPSDLRFTPLMDLDVSGNKIRGVVPPLLCLMEDLNGNGANDDFNCHKVACPAGTYNSLGRYDEEGEGLKCLPCLDDNPYIGRKTCSNPGGGASSSPAPQKGILETIQESSAGLSVSGKVGLGVAVGALLVAISFCICLRRVRGRRRKPGPKRIPALRRNSNDSVNYSIGDGDSFGDVGQAGYERRRESESYDEVTGREINDYEEDSSDEKKNNLRQFSEQSEETNRSNKPSRFKKFKNSMGSSRNLSSNDGSDEASAQRAMLNANSKTSMPENGEDDDEEFIENPRRPSFSGNPPKKSKGRRRALALPTFKPGKSKKKYSTVSGNADAARVDAEWGVAEYSDNPVADDARGGQGNGSIRMSTRSSGAPKMSDLLDVPSIDD